jgi:hypothetical protein
MSIILTHEAIKVRAKNNGITYKPHDCDTGVVSGILWSTKYRRIQAVILYDNGAADSIPLFGLEKLFDVLN